MQAGLFFFPFRFRAEVWVHLEDQMFIMEGGSARIASLLFVFKAVRLNGKLRSDKYSASNCTYAPRNELDLPV